MREVGTIKAMGELSSRDFRKERAPRTFAVEPGKVFYLDKDERYEAARKDPALRVFCELQVLQYNLTDLPEEEVDALEEYRPEDMVHDLWLNHRLDADDAFRLIQETVDEVRGWTEETGAPHAY